MRPERQPERDVDRERKLRGRIALRSVRRLRRAVPVRSSAGTAGRGGGSKRIMRRWTAIPKLAAALALAGWILPVARPGDGAVFGSDEPLDHNPCAGHEHEDWRWNVSLDQGSGKVGIRPIYGPRREGFCSLEEALDSLDEDRIVVWIRLDPVPLDTSDRMQQELFDYYAQHYPEALEAATASSGNLHNPALRPLIPSFREAVRSTSHVAELGKLLERYDHRIVGVSFEKFSLRTRQKPPRFSAITAVTLEKQSVETPAEENPRPER